MNTDETKICKICCKEIPAGAKKCPYCQHWQYKLSMIVVHPMFGMLIAIIAISIFYIMYGSMMKEITHRFKGIEDLHKYSNQIEVTASKLKFGEDENGPTVAIVGKVKNLSEVNWKEVHFRVDFVNLQNKLVDAGQDYQYSYYLPSGQEASFKVSFRREFPESEYADYKISVISAKDARISWF